MNVKDMMRREKRRCITRARVLRRDPAGRRYYVRAALVFRQLERMV